MKIDEYKDADNLASAKRAWEDLFANPAWVSLMEAVQAQTDHLQREVLFGRITSQEELFDVERKKGQLEGRLSLTSTATAMYEGLCADLETARRNKGED